MSEIEKLKGICTEIADEIEAKVKEERKKNFACFGKEIRMGADGTHTQYIDKIAEDIALNVVDKKMNILSEEAGFIDYGMEYTIVIDPIDGTRNAVHDIPFYCTSMAIGKSNLRSIEYALVRNIPAGDTYVAEKGKGAFLNGKKIKVDTALTDPIFSLVLGKSGDEKTWKAVNIYSIRSLGAAALEMCLVASGSINAYFEGKEHLRVTDFAASTLIVREAGGKVFDAKGNILDAGFDLEKRSSVLAVSCEKILEELI
ncbi:MAG: inositol monophosphatase family protein [Candidatus Thermoplasmatota archaeon]|nr:inositol monophosphatase family protein [Candidatus Thermoplasmatota archaeon]